MEPSGGGAPAGTSSVQAAQSGGSVHRRGRVGCERDFPPGCGPSSSSSSSVVGPGNRPSPALESCRRDFPIGCGTSEKPRLMIGRGGGETSSTARLEHVDLMPVKQRPDLIPGGFVKQRDLPGGAVKRDLAGGIVKGDFPSGIGGPRDDGRASTIVRSDVDRVVGGVKRSNSVLPMKRAAPERRQESSDVIHDKKSDMEKEKEKRVAPERQSYDMHRDKKLAIEKEKDKDGWRRPVTAVKSKVMMVSNVGRGKGPVVDGIKKPSAEVHGACSSSRAGLGPGKGIVRSRLGTEKEAEGSDRNVGREQRAREVVMETLRLFRARCSALLSGRAGDKLRRIDFQVMNQLKAEGKVKNLEKEGKVIGNLPGVWIGDEFIYRVELYIIGLHGRLQNGIDYTVKNCEKVATCVVATEGYYDNMTDSEILEYTGEGGVFMDKGKPPEDQKMTHGNLALKNSRKMKYPVRVVRGFKTGNSHGDLDTRAVKTVYVYDGLYDVTDCKTTKGARGNLMYQFTLRRHPNQPVVNWRKYKH